MTQKLLYRKALENLQPYVGPRALTGDSRDIVRLASNENPRGPSPKALRAVAQYQDFHRYPDGSATALRLAIAEKHQVHADQVTIGNGSNEIIELVAHAMLDANTNSVFSEYAFAVYPLATTAQGAEGRCASATEDYGHDLHAMAQMIDAQTRIVFVAQPNNPTGTAVSNSELRTFVANIPHTCVVFLDLAYSDYIDPLEDPDYPSYAAWHDVHPNIMFSYTFSKAHGLAAMRIGYGITSAALTELLNRIRQPFNVNAIAQTAACESLADISYIRDVVTENNSERTSLLDFFNSNSQAENLRAYPSKANFLMIESTGDRSGDMWAELLFEQGILVRSLKSYDLPMCFRVTIGTQEQNLQLMRAIQKVNAY